MLIKEQIAQAITHVIKKEVSIESSPNPLFGDFAIPCFKLGITPQELQKIKLPKIVERTEIKGMYLNLFLKKEQWATQVINRILKEKDNYGTQKEGKGKTALIEHTSINPNASPHVGRARNAILGAAIVNLLKFQKYKTKVHYFVNDVGKQIAMLVIAAGSKTPTFHELLSLYVDYNKKIESHPEEEQKVFDVLKKLEAGDPKTKAKFKKIVNICIKGQKKILEDLGITYDIFDFESKFLWNKETEQVLKSLEKTGRLSKDEEGRTVINLEGFKLPMEHPILPITRADGTSLYMLRDLAFTQEKNAQKTAKNIIVLGEDQKLYFQQLKAILSLLNQPAPEVVHYAFVLLEEGKMATRSGNVVLLEDFMKEAKDKAAAELKEREITDESLAKIIGYGAVKFAFLRISAEKNITFSWEKALSFEGESSPYIQYAIVRANSLEQKEPLKQKKVKCPHILPEEIALIRALGVFPERVATATKQLQPHIIAIAALDLAKKFNEFYHAVPVLKAEEKEKLWRLAIVKTSAQTLTNAINLLGIDAPTQM